MKLNIFLFFSIQILITLLSHSAVLDEWGRAMDLSFIPIKKRIPCLANECADIYQKSGYVGINLRAFKEMDLSKVFLFPTETHDISNFRSLFSKEISQLHGYENVFLVLLSTNCRNLSVELYVESNYHCINDMSAAFRKEAQCYRRALYYTFPAESLPAALALKKSSRVSEERAYAIYDRFLTHPASLKEFLSLFIKKVSKSLPSKGTSELKTLQSTSLETTY